MEIISIICNIVLSGLLLVLLPEYKVYRGKNKKLEKENEALEEENKKLKERVEEISDKFVLSLKDEMEKLLTGGQVAPVGIAHTISQSLDDFNVAIYVEDILGGEVIKQEGTKVILISKEGEVREGLSKQDPDENYSYKLVRE